MDLVPQLNHTIVWCRDKLESSVFLTEIMGLPRPTSFGPFCVVELDNKVSLDYHDTTDDVSRQHYAFLVSEDGFTEIFDRLVQRDIEYWADPGQHRTAKINHNDGGRGLYFEDPNGHLLEIITVPYGGGGVA